MLPSGLLLKTHCARGAHSMTPTLINSSTALFFRTFASNIVKPSQLWVIAVGCVGSLFRATTLTCPWRVRPCGFDIPQYHISTWGSSHPNPLSIRTVLVIILVTHILRVRLGLLSLAIRTLRTPHVDFSVSWPVVIARAIKPLTALSFLQLSSLSNP